MRVILWIKHYAQIRADRHCGTCHPESAAGAYPGSMLTLAVQLINGSRIGRKCARPGRAERRWPYAGDTSKTLLRIFGGVFRWVAASRGFPLVPGRKGSLRS